MGKKRILLLKVPASDYIGKTENEDPAEKYAYWYHPSYTLSVISSFLYRYLKIEYELKIIDINMLCVKNRTLEVQEMAKTMRNVLEQERYDFLLISCQFMFNQQWVEEAIDIAQSSNPESIKIIGGGFSTIFVERAIQYPNVDYAVTGEGEHVIVHIINKACDFKDPEFEKLFVFDGYAEKQKNGSINIVKKKNMIKPMDILPLPNWDWMDFDTYKKNFNNPYLPVMSSRGCPCECNYCSTRLYWGSVCRYRPVEHVVQEIRNGYERYGIKHYRFLDDNPLLFKKWFLDFYEKFKELPKDITIDFNNISSETLDEEMLDILKELNVKVIAVAVESGSKEIQKKINKKLDLEVVERKIKLIRDKGFQIYTLWMIGFPGETLSQINETVDMARRTRADQIQIFPVFPFPGTRMYDELKKNNLVVLDENDYKSMKYRTTGKILSAEWDGIMIMRIAFDATIEMNFLDNLLYNSPEGRKQLISRFEESLKIFPKHAIARICLGYIEGIYNKNDKDKDMNYKNAFDVLEDKGLVFKKYLDWDFPQIRDFKVWAGQHQLTI